MSKRLRKLTSFLLSIVMVISMVSVGVVSVNAGTVIENAVSWALAIANDNSHGYSQLSNRRWGNPDYDCSSFVITAFKNAGCNVGAATYTGNMRSVFVNAGFTWIPKSQINLSNSSQLQRGDILLNEKNHTEIYIGNNQRVGAHTGTYDIYDRNAPGDNNGKEISVYNYSNSSNWDGVLRYNENSNFPGEEDKSYNVPVWKTANSKLDTYDSNGNKESGRWIDAGDNCYIEKVYKNGYAWVKYPTSNGDRWAYTTASGFSLDRNPPTNVYLDKNQYWYDIQDTITLYPHADNATSYWLSVYKGDNHIVDTSVDGEYSFSASQWGYGDYYAWITASNSVGGTDSERISFTVCGVPSYSDIWTSKGFYDWDENEQIKINVSTVCAKGQCIGIDFLDNNLNYVKRIITENCDTTFTVSAKTLGIGYFSAYFSVFNGSGGIDTKKVYFYIGQKKDLGAEFCAKIKNQSLNKYLTAVGNNVEGKDENCDKQQVWFFYRLSDGSYKIKNYYDWRSMDVHNYADAGAGTNVQVYEDWDSDAQRFYIYEICGAYYIKPVCTDMVLDMSQSTYNLEVWGAGFNWTPQKFDIEKIEESDIGVHKYTEKVVPPTKDNNGYTEHICSICGHSYKDTYTYIGDINNDGNVNILDATMIQKHSAELELLDDNLCKYADVNGDGKVSVIDATLIQKYSAELITEF